MSAVCSRPLLTYKRADVIQHLFNHHFQYKTKKNVYILNNKIL